MAKRRSGPDTRPRDTDPITLTSDPTGGQVERLWRTTNDRFPESRKRIRRARDIANKAPWTLTDQLQPTSTSTFGLTLPQRALAITMTNSLSSQYGTPELTRYGKPVASDKSDVIETVLKATLSELISAPDLFGKACQDGEWGVAVLPASERWDHVPVYSAEGYDLDDHDRDDAHPDYSGRDPARSRRKYDRDYEDFCARCDYVAVDLIDPTDCAPILTRGTHGRRFTARGLVVRRLFEREELLSQGYRSAALASEKATLIPRGDKATVRGKGGKLYLYTVYLSLWDEDDEDLVPCIVYSVGGEDTTRYSPRTDQQEPALINLKEEWGITTPMWGYYYGLRSADPDPDNVGKPFLDGYGDLVLSLERMLAASVHHAERSSFKGSWVVPAENVPPEAYTETVDNQLRLKQFDEPQSGELMTAPGQVTPVAPPPLGPAASQMLGAMLGQLEATAPDPSQPAGSAASGHAMSLASGLIEAAHADIPRGVLECYQDVAQWTLECVCAVMKTRQVPWVIDANEELPPDEPGDHRSVSQRYVVSEKDLGDSYKITATWRQRPDPTNVTLAMDRAVKGYASIIDVLEAAGETNSTFKCAEILYYRAVMTPGSPENLELSAYIARKRGEQDKAAQLELQAKQLLGPQGTPTDAIAPEAQQMAAQAAGGGGQPSGVATGVKSSIAASVQGAQEQGPTTSDAMAAAQMGIRPGIPPSVGAGGRTWRAVMAKPLGVSFAEVYANVGNDLMRRLGDAQAAMAGPPLTEPIQPAGDTERVKAWNARRPEATDAAMQQLASQKYAEHRQSGMDDQKAQLATAEDLTHFRYGQRLHLYTYGQVDAKAQVAEAKRIAALAARESTPDPLQPPPTMPSAYLTNAAMLGEPAPAPPVPIAPPPAAPEPAPPAPNGGYPA